MAVKSDLPKWDVWLKNRLLKIIPTFDTFDVNPSNPELMTDGDFTTESGEGVKNLGAPADIGRIYFDMGAAYPIHNLVTYFNAHRASGDGSITVYLDFSYDGITYLYFATSKTGLAVDLYNNAPVYSFYARYLRMRFTAVGTTVASVYHVKVAEVQAIQLI